MNKALTFFVLSAVLLITYSLGENVSASADSRKAFQDSVIAKLTTLSEEPLKLGIKLLQETHDDNSNNESVKDYLNQILREYVNVTTENSQNKIRLFLRLSLAFDFFSGPISDEWQRRDFLLLVKGAFEKHDVKGAAVELQKTYDEYLNWLIREINEYSHKFTSVEQLRVNEFKKLCMQFKEKTYFDERLPVVESLVAILKE